jgi:hypothetical protein
MIYSTLLSKLRRAGRRRSPLAAVELGPEAGLVLVADGVGGLDLCVTSLKHVLAGRGGSLVVRSHVWGHGFGRWHADLTDVANRDAQAHALALAVRARREAAPGAPVYLVGKSGGTGVVVRALEELEADAVEAAVLLAPALSPGYDLTRALAAVRREMVVFWSPLDVVILGLGTRVFGTIDRVRTVSAGLVGFRGNPAKLRQVRWGPRMIGAGYLGGHVAGRAPRR